MAGTPSGRVAAGGAPTALVLPTQFRAGPYVVRSLTRAGYRVLGAQPAGRGAGGRSRACPRPIRHPVPSRDPEGFRRWLDAICRNEGVDVVVPTTEDAVRLFARNRVEGGPVVAAPTQAQFDVLCDKARLAEAAAAAEVPHPETVAVGVDGVAAGALPAPPCVVKPAESGEDAGDVPPAVIARTAAERDAALARLRAAGTRAVVQEYLDGPRWFAHCVRGDGWFRMVGYRVFADWPRREGPASFFRQAATPPVLEQKIRRLLENAGYRGACSVGFIESRGRLIVHDVNLRIGSTVAASIHAGLDVPALAVAAALGAPPPGPWPGPGPVTHVRIDGELGGLVPALRRRGDERVGRQLGRLARGVVRRDWILVPSPADPYWLADVAWGRLLGTARRLRR